MSRWLLPLLMCCALVLPAPPASAGEGSATGEEATSRHCVATASLYRTENAAERSPAARGQDRCFTTLDAAVRFATDGHVGVPKGLSAPRASDVTRSYELNPNASFILSIEYGDRDWTGSTLTIRASTGTGCRQTPSEVYKYSPLPSGWNDEISSSFGYTNCFSYHWEHTFSGAFEVCKPNCRSLTAMNDETSSITYKRP